VNWEESIATSKLGDNSTALNETDDSVIQTDLIDEKRQSFINFYIAIIVTFIVVIRNAEFSFYYALIRASKNLHDLMFRGLIGTFVQFFNQNPSGRILNRFSKDIGNIDTVLPTTLFECLSVRMASFSFE
jgi:ATP-binding cassette, subfamily C (CFTR/MRP), member 4